MDRFQAVPDVGKCPADDHGHGVIEVGLFHLVLHVPLDHLSNVLLRLGFESLRLVLCPPGSVNGERVGGVVGSIFLKVFLVVLPGVTGIVVFPWLVRVLWGLKIQ